MNYKTFTLYIILIGIVAASCGKDTSKYTEKYEYHTLPVYEKAVSVPFDSLVFRPVRVQLFMDTLYISYAMKARIDLFSWEFEYIKTIELNKPDEVFPTSFAVTDSIIIVADHAKGLILTYDRNGQFINSFGFLPDSASRLAPFSLVYYGGVAYIGDIGMKKVLAVSMTDVQNLTETGELILEIPADTMVDIGLPSAVYVTFDGRLLIGDAQNGIVRTFTCDGRFIYNFDSIPGYNKVTPQVFDVDRIIDPSLQDTSSFDPSGVRNMGRLHVVDSYNGAVHMFNPLGKYVASYADSLNMKKPSGIAIDRKRRRIFIADPAAEKILVYKY